MRPALDIAAWVWSLLGEATAAAMLVGIAGWLLRTQIGHWLSRDLEDRKSQYARELEAYRVSLIAQTERTKAKQDLQKAGALLIIEKKYQGLHRLHSSLGDMPGTVCTALQLPAGPDKERVSGEAQAQFKEFVSSCNDLRPFLDAADWGATLHYREVLLAVIARAIRNEVGDANEVRRVQGQLAVSGLVVDQLVRRQVEAMMSLDGAE